MTLRSMAGEHLAIQFEAGGHCRSFAYSLDKFGIRTILTPRQETAGTITILEPYACSCDQIFLNAAILAPIRGYRVRSGNF